MNNLESSAAALLRPLHAPVFASSLLNSPAVEVDEREGEILLHLALPGNAATLVDFAAARITFAQGRMCVHLPRRQAEEIQETGSRSQEAGTNAFSSFPGEGRPSGKLGDHYVPNAGEDHISQQQAIEVRTEVAQGVANLRHTKPAQTP